MVDLIYGRGISDIIRETPFYINFLSKYMKIRIFHSKTSLYGSVNVNNICNLHCSHCYWWLNRKEGEQDLTTEDWRSIIRTTFKKQHVFFVTFVGGEPTLRPDIIEVYCEEMPKRVCVVTNGTIPLKRFENLYFYWVSLDGTEKVHDRIRGSGSYAKTRQNILDYVAGGPRLGCNKPAWKDIWLSMTINSLNYDTITGLVQEWRGKVNKIAFQFYTAKCSSRYADRVT